MLVACEMKICSSINATKVVIVGGTPGFHDNNHKKGKK
jgi:hypothetical protein